MKTSILVALAATLTFALAGCGGGSGGNTANNTATDPSGLTNGVPTVAKVTATLNTATLADSASVVNGVYHLSNPGALKINYDVSFVVGAPQSVALRANLSNSQVVNNIWDDFTLTQQLGEHFFAETTATNLIGTMDTFNSAAQFMINPSPANGIDYTKPTFILVTLFTADTNVPVVLGTPIAYVSSQKAIPITILP